MTIAVSYRAIFRRVVHALSSLLAGVGVSFALFLVLVSVGMRGHLTPSTPILMGVLWILPLLIAGVCIWRRASYGLLLPVLGLGLSTVYYFILDDANPPPPSPHSRTLVRHDDPHYQTYRRMLDGDPHSRLNEIAAKLQDLPTFPLEPGDWSAFVAAHRDQLELSWTENTLGRTWVETVAAMNSDAMFPIDPTFPELAFDELKKLVDLHWAKTWLLLEDERPEDSVEVLIPLIKTCHQIMGSEAQLLRQLIALTFLHGTQEHIRAIMETGLLSDASRQELSMALATSPPITRCIANVYLGEEVVMRSTLQEVASTLLLHPFTSRSKWIVRMCYNANRTEREYMELMNTLRVLAEKRETEAMKAIVTNHRKMRRLKNPGGQVLLSLTVPEFSGMVEQLWESDADRQALIRELNRQGD